MTHDSRDEKPKKEQPKKDQQPKRQQAGNQATGNQATGNQATGNRGNGKGLEGEAQRHIGRMLKATYEEIAHEPVPDKFLELLKQLESSEPRK